MRNDLSLSQVCEITDMFDGAMDCALASKAETRQEFALLVLSYVIDSLTEQRVLRPVIAAKYLQLSDHYGQFSLGKGVINDGRGGRC